MSNGTKRVNMQVGFKERIAMKKDLRSEKLSQGIVRDMLVKSATHSHGIEVRLEI